MRLVIVVAVIGTLTAATVAYLLYSGGPDGRGGIARIGGPFELVDHRNQPRTDRDFLGQYMLVYFGYTYCPDICPTALQIMTTAMDQLAASRQKKITPVFITVDPERDTVENLGTYVEHFHPRTVGLTGTEAQIASVARAYRVYFGKAKDSEGLDDYLVDHSSIIFLMGTDGGYITHFTHATAPEKLASVLRDLVKG